MSSWVGAGLDDVLAAAAEIRQRAHGNRVTFSPKVFVPLTELCLDRCGYCTFAKPPARLDAPFLDADAVLAIARLGVRAGCHEVLFTLGERPEDRYPAAQAWLADRGWACTVDYLAAMCALVRDETGLLPHANPGALHPDELARLRPVAASMGMMLESLNGDSGVPPRLSRQGALAAAGHPGRRGTAVHPCSPPASSSRIGETRQDRHRRPRGTLPTPTAGTATCKKVIVQNFCTQTRHGHARVTAVPTRRVPGGRSPWPGWCSRRRSTSRAPQPERRLRHALGAGIDDWGGGVAGHPGPRQPGASSWPAAGARASVPSPSRLVSPFAPRLTISPEFAADPDRWLDPAMRFAVMDHSDAEHLGARPSMSGSRARGALPPALVPGDPSESGLLHPRHPRSAVLDVALDGVMDGGDVDTEEIVTLFAARGHEVRAVAEVADELRRQAVGDVVTFVVNRNINYTNVCTFKCRFCAFSKGAPPH